MNRSNYAEDKMLTDFIYFGRDTKTLQLCVQNIFMAEQCLTNHMELIQNTNRCFNRSVLHAILCTKCALRLDNSAAISWCLGIFWTVARVGLEPLYRAVPDKTHTVGVKNTHCTN